MIGVVLSGGQSLRMGKDKGLLQNGQQTWAQQAFAKLSSLQIPVAISVNTLQLPIYQTVFSTSSLITDEPVLSIGGPLRGILSVHLIYPKEDLLVLACDMINMEVDLLDFVVQQYEDKPADALVFMKEKQSEPLCGIYSAKALDKVYALYMNQELHKHSMKYALEQLDACYLPVPKKWKAYFDNYNTISDLNNI
nr:molybdenum cofactor guanylyltransferase [uncultured Pedobacter sp.]